MITNTTRQVFRFSGEIRNRNEFGTWLTKRGLLGNAVEVGVNRGENALQLLNRWKGRALYLVDTWRHMDNYHDSANRSDEEREKDHQRVLKRVKGRYPDRVQILRMTSAEAVRVVPDGLDFAYIDADHSFESVTEDLRLWWPKVKSGGVMAGHDVLFPGHIGVTNALVDFSRTIGRTITITPATFDAKGKRTSAHSWFVEKL